MITRFLIGIKSFSQIKSVFDGINYVNNKHISKLLDFYVKNKVDLTFCNNLIHYLSFNVCNLELEELNSLVKNSLYTNYKLNSRILNNILDNLNCNYYFNGNLALDTLYHLLLLDSSNFLSKDKCVELIDKYRLSTNNCEQLKLLNVVYNIQFYHSVIESHYTPQLTNYVKYLKLLSPKILLRCGIYGESNEIVQIKKTMDKLNVEYVSGITGHVYSPIILKGTNMAIDVSCERNKYYEPADLNRIVALKEFIMNEMGWKLRFIPIEEWNYNISDEDRRNYLTKFICKYYVDTQFDKNPPWVAL